MPLRYLGPGSAWLRQGEIIENVLELGPVVAQGEWVEVTGNQGTPLDKIRHPRAVIVSQDCDLEWDYKAKESLAPDHKLLRHVLLCDLFTRAEIRDRSSLNSGLLDRVKQNQDERYHRFDEAEIGDTEINFPELIADFKAIFSLPTEFVYALVSSGQVTRRGLLPPLYLHDFIHRLYSFLSRVALPE